MYKIEKLGKIVINKGYVFNIGNKEIVTNMEKWNRKDMVKIVNKLIDIKVFTKTDEFKEDGKIFNNLLIGMKTLGNLEKNINIDFEKITDKENNNISYWYNIHTNSFGGGNKVKKIKIILV